MESIEPTIEELIKQIDHSLNLTEENLKNKIRSITEDKKIFTAIGDIFNNLRTELKSALDPDQKLKVVLVGQTNSGKTSIIQAFTGSEEEPKRTLHPEWVEYGGLTLLDSCGFQSNNSQIKSLTNVIKQKTPDTVFVILNAHAIREWGDYRKPLNEQLNTIMKACKDAKSSLPKIYLTGAPRCIPIFWIVTKMDIASDELKPYSRDPIESLAEWKERINPKSEEIFNLIKAKLKPFKYYTDQDPVFFTAIPSLKHKDTHFCVESLVDGVSVVMPLNTQIQRNNKKRYEAKRRTIAMKIISSFSGLAAVISLLPLIDIPLTVIIQDCMLSVLETLRTNPNRTAESLRSTGISAGILTTTYLVRGGLLLAFFLLELTGVGAAISLPAGALVTSSSLMGVGIYAYNYFTGDDIKGDNK